MAKLLLRVSRSLTTSSFLPTSLTGGTNKGKEPSREPSENAVSVQESFPEPSRYLKVPEKLPPTGMQTIEAWKSESISDPSDIRLKPERYQERFIVAEEINTALKEGSDNFEKILEIIEGRQHEFDNMNAFNALGYLHASSPRSAEICAEQSLLSDMRFLLLCNLLYKKCRSYPPNACISNVARLLDLGVPFKTPLIYVYLSLLKNSFNSLTISDGLTLARCLAPYNSLLLPTALHAGVKALLFKAARENFNAFAAELEQQNTFYGDLNLLILLDFFGPDLAPRLRSRILRQVAGSMMKSNALRGSDLLSFVKLIAKNWVSSGYANLCFNSLEGSLENPTLLDALEVARACHSFKRLREPLLLKRCVDTAAGVLSSDPSDGNLSVACDLLYYLAKVNFTAPALFQLVEQHHSSLDLLQDFGLTDFAETVLLHLENNEPALRRTLKVLTTCSKLTSDKDLLLSVYLTERFGVNIAKKDLPLSLSQIESMLAGITNEVSAKFQALPKLLDSFEKAGAEVANNDLVLRMYLPAIFEQKKLYIVPVYGADFYQNRFDVIWTCRLRFILLQKFLIGSESSVTVVPIDLTRYQSFQSSHEKLVYVKYCLKNGGDRHVNAML